MKNTKIESQNQKQSNKYNKITQSKKKQNQNNQYDELQLRRKLQLFQQKIRFKNLKNKILTFIGKNYAISYRKQYDFTQQWENSQTKQSQSNFIFYHDNVVFQFLQFMVMINFSVTIWYRSVDYFFYGSPQTNSLIPIYLSNLIFQFMDAGLKMWLKNKAQVSLSLSDVFKTIYANLVCFVVILFAYIDIQPAPKEILILIQLVNLYFLFVRARQLYQIFRFKNVVLAYDYQMKVFDLIFSLIMVAHFFAIVLYLSTTLGYDRNWLQLKDLQGQNKIQVYLYSFYYCTTTILTVGYGDLTPQNVAEVAIVIWVQIFGIVTFAYIINQIGYTLGQVRKERQVLDKDLMTMKKMKHYYKIDTDLMDEARSCLINQTDNVKDQLTPEEQNSLIMKLNEDLRNSIYMENSLSVIKSSIFFLCRWSKAFQTAISSKLQHKLFSPEERIYQPPGKERIYIIRLGRIEIYPEKRGSRKELTNILKKVEVELSDEVCDNCYGYTAVISKTPVNLKAIAKKFTSCYFIEKDKFFDCTKERYSDEEYLHEIKDKIQLSFQPFSFEIPDITSGKLHYNPTKGRILYRHTKERIIKNERGYILRKRERSSKSQLFINDQAQRKIKYAILESTPDLQVIQRSSAEMTMIERGKTGIQCFSNDFIKQAQKLQAEKSYHYRQKHNKIDFQSQSNDFDIKKIQFNQKSSQTHLFQFQQSKRFQNYFKDYNVKEVIDKYQLQSYSLKNYKFKEIIDNYPCLRQRHLL